MIVRCSECKTLYNPEANNFCPECSSNRKDKKSKRNQQWTEFVDTLPNSKINLLRWKYGQIRKKVILEIKAEFLDCDYCLPKPTTEHCRNCNTQICNADFHNYLDKLLLEIKEDYPT